MKRRATTMQDIADRVGVSRMAVSVALHGSRSKSNVGLSDQTRARILEAARLLRYRPNAIARSLRRRRTNVIGFYSGYGPIDPRVSFYSQILAGIQQACVPLKRDLLLHTTFGGLSTDEIYSELVDGRIDGLIMFSPPEDPLAERLAESHLPVVVVADAIPTLPSVLVDDVQGAALTFDYLIARGHRHVVYRSLNTHLVSAERRTTAFLAAARERRILSDEWCSPIHMAEGDPYFEQLAQRPRVNGPSAVVCWNDVAAFDLLSHCLKRGIRVPEDLAIVGFDGDEFHTKLPWKMTTVRAPWEQVARKATRLLTECADGVQIPMETVLPVEFIRGDSA